LSDRIAAYWTNFAKTGDPNGNGLPEWPAYDARSDLQMELGETVAQRPAPHKVAPDFYEAYFAKVHGH
jgi:para-nitrobenzyl esterase